MLRPETDSRVNTGLKWKYLLLSLNVGYKFSGFVLKRCYWILCQSALFFKHGSTHSLYSCFSQWYLQINASTYIVGCILLFQEHSEEKSYTEVIGKEKSYTEVTGKESRVEYLLSALTFTSIWWQCCSKWYTILGSKVGILITKNIL